MPRATDNRKAIGTEKCRACGEEAEFYQVQKGRKVGQIYRKGCDCKAIQNAPPFKQLEWFNTMTRTPHEAIPFPYKSGAGVEEPEPLEKTPEETPAKPQASSEGNPEKKASPAGIAGFLIIAGGIVAALLT
jgi:hypothetical protein